MMRGKEVAFPSYARKVPHLTTASLSQHRFAPLPQRVTLKLMPFRTQLIILAGGPVAGAWIAVPGGGPIA